MRSASWATRPRWKKQLRRFADIGVTEFVASPKEVPSSDGAATVAKTTEFLASLRL
ncbi:hypothetical protein [Mycolicibacterium septicum]|uniref:hypothetical protein n=1 Tax=Mycolicibacterium septicum TaxID=98668 RepID=UPI001AF8D16E|nr:hypothetical protein [Mycolicibacterium septicum]QRY49314.1 hypothetical protein JVX95_17060 [Mycolicibacterium septicum]